MFIFHLPVTSHLPFFSLSATSHIYLSSPCRALSMASGSSERSNSCVTPGEPRHSVESRLMTVEMLGLLFVSGVAVMLPGVDVIEVPTFEDPAQDKRCKRSSTRPCWARGAGSMPRRVKRSANDAKHRRAPSATWRERTDAPFHGTNNTVGKECRRVLMRVLNCSCVIQTDTCDSSHSWAISILLCTVVYPYPLTTRSKTQQIPL